MTPPHYTEQKFETHIESHLLDSGYIKKTPADYDKDLCLIPSEVIQFIKTSQPDEYKKLQKQYGAAADTKLCYRLSRETVKRGALHVLRKGIKDVGAKFRLAYYKPSSGMNPEHQKLYSKNRFSIPNPKR